MRLPICFKVTTAGGKSIVVGWGLARHYRLFRWTRPHTAARMFGYDLLAFDTIGHAYQWIDPGGPYPRLMPKLYLCIARNLRAPKRPPGSPRTLWHLYIAIDGDPKGFKYLARTHDTSNRWPGGTLMASAVLPLIRIPVFRIRRKR